MMCSHEKTKTTFTILRTACEGGLPNYCCFTGVGAFFFFWYDNFVFIYLCIFLFFFFVLKLNVGRDIYMDETTLKNFVLDHQSVFASIGSIYSSLFVEFIHPLLDRLSYGYRNLFDVLNNKY